MSHLPAVCHLDRLIRRFAASERGNVAMIFALCVFVMMVFMGMAIDYGRAARARLAMQNALDATALMLSKDLSQGTITEPQLPAKAEAYFNSLYTDNEAQGVTINTTYTAQSTTSPALVSLSASGYVKSYFMQIAGYPTMNFGTSTGTAWGTTRLRVALALDNTGSMLTAGKMDALVGGAQTLVDQLMASATPGSDDVMISIVPFTAYVNVGSSNVDAPWLGAWTTPRAGAYNFTTNAYSRNILTTGLPAWEGEAPGLTLLPKPASWASAGPGSPCPINTIASGLPVYCTTGQPTPAQQTFDNTPPTTPTVPGSGTFAGRICPAYDAYNELFYNGCYTSVSNGSGNFTHQWVPFPRSNWNGCVTDRDEPYDTRNDTPVGSDTDPTKFPVVQGMGCPAPITPLSRDAGALKANIRAMVALNLGTTNQLIGLGWGWMTLKPGEPFGAGNPLNAPDPPSAVVNRAVIILSDGMNTQSRMYGGAYLGYNGTAVTIDSREKILCDNMKADGIKIYAIQVNTGGDPESQVLKYCASDPDDFFYLTSANQVMNTFKSIGTKLTSLRITN